METLRARLLRASCNKVWILAPMTWNRRYQVKSYLRSALWIIPFVAVPLQQVAWVLTRTLDARFWLR